MRTTLDIYSMTKQHNPELSSGRKTQTEDWDNFCNLDSQKLNSNLNSNSEFILTQLRLDAIESELALACSLYRERCQELDRITWQNEQYSDCSLELESQKICQEIFTVINKISRLELERINTCQKLNHLSFNKK